jgi:hypothetical protein
MSLVAVLVCRLRMLLGAVGVFLTLHVIALAVVFRGGAMRLGGIFVVLGSLAVFVLCHLRFLLFQLPDPENSSSAD